MPPLTPSPATPDAPTPELATRAPGIVQTPTVYPDGKLLEMFKRWKAESFDQRWVYERQWMRNVWYILNRQWIYYDTTRGQWQDKRLAKWVPRPVTNICKEAVQAVRANFAAVNYGTMARPIGNSTKNVVTAGIADDYVPVLYDLHQMDQVMTEYDFWLLTAGNAWLHTCVNYDRKNGMLENPYELCTACGQEMQSSQIAEAGGKCACGNATFIKAQNPDGSPKVERRPRPAGLTIPLSPFEIAFPLVYERFDEAPYCIRMRWRDKSYYEGHPELSQLARTLPFSKSPADRTMQIFKTLPFQNDLGMSPAYFGMGGGASTESEGITEFDVWVRPCEEFPEGQVIRFAGDQNPVVIHSAIENLPGPIPYHDAQGNPLFTFTHGVYDHVGGRALGSGLIDPIVQKQDQLNQIDSMMLMCMMRMSNPVWLEPKGAEVEKFTGQPGLVVKWNPLVGNGNAKPERIPGENIPVSMFQYRELIKKEAEELAGTFDILKGNRPAGVEAYAAINLLIERGQARHATAYKQRGASHRAWYKFALEIEREFGDETRTRAVMQPTKGWAFETFKRADLSGSVEILIEDGTLTPKTTLGERAAIEHLASLGLLKADDPDQLMEIYRKFGQSGLMPGLDAQVKECWMYMEQFEKAMSDPRVQQLLAAPAQPVVDPMTGQPAPPPTILRFKRWYNPVIHRQEVIKWCVSDTGRNLFSKFPAAEAQIDAYLQQIEAMLAQQAALMAPKPPVNPGGGAEAMANSNRNAAGAGKTSSGSAGTGEKLQEAA